jgi:hypothetical protein
MDPNTNEQITENNPESSLEKIKHPKRKFVLIHGYNGHNYKGNQK